MLEHEPVEFECVECGSLVVMAIGPVPVPARCGVCQWIAAEIDPADYPLVKAALRISGVLP